MADMAMLGAGLIGMFYTMALTAKRGPEKIQVACGADAVEVKRVAEKRGIALWTTRIEDAALDPNDSGARTGSVFRCRS